MEFPKEIENWLETIPVRRKEGFIRYVKQNIYVLLFLDNYSKEEFNKILAEKKQQIINYMNEEDPKDRKHGSKGIKHKERGVSYVQGIVDRFDNYGVDYIKLFKEIYDVDLKEKNDGYLGLCPIHKENTPSLSISVRKGVVKCYGCGHGGGGIISFMKKTLNKSVPEVFGMVEKYILSKEDSEKNQKYWIDKSYRNSEKSLSKDSEKEINNLNGDGNLLF